MDIDRIRSRVFSFSASKDVNRITEVSRSFRETAIDHQLEQYQQFFDDILLLDSYDIFEKYAYNKHLIVYVYGVYSEDFIDYCLLHNEKLLILLLEEFVHLCDQKAVSVEKNSGELFTIPFDNN
jgi:hypothetical protein